MSLDPGLDRAVDWFKAQPQMAERFGSAIRKALDEVFDGQRTGRYALTQLSKVEKTYIGTKVEIVVQAEFGLQRGQRMDYLVAGEDIDAKWSMRSGGWMIPSVGIVRADENSLRSSRNKDQKRSLSKDGVSAMSWLEEKGSLIENLLLHLDETTRSSILDYNLSGQQRINQLFRLVHSRVVGRGVILTVAQQDDGVKRTRDARKHLQPEGIVILGHQQNHPRIAKGLGLKIPSKGSWIAARLAKTHEQQLGAVEINGSFWKLASEKDAQAAGPLTYQ